MDLKGQIVDTKVRVKPSVTLLLYIRKLQYEEDMPSNIAKIINGSTYEAKETVIFHGKADTTLTKKEMEIMSEVKSKFGKIQQNVDATTESIEEGSENENTDNTESESRKPQTDVKSKKNENNIISEDEEIMLHLTVNDVEWLYAHLKEQRNSGAKDVPYLNELLQGCEVEVPQNAVLTRDPALEARCVRLRAQQAAREYRAMTKGVDNVRMRFPEDNISYQLKQLNRQLIVIGQFLLSIFAGFLFGFKGVDLMVGDLDFGFRLLLGVMCALIIALAEIYFIAKKLNEELSVPETTQIGGPVKFAGAPDPPRPVLKNNTKEHQE